MRAQEKSIQSQYYVSKDEEQEARYSALSKDEFNDSLNKEIWNFSLSDVKLPLPS